MTTPRPRQLTPLRDRRLTAQDPVKSSILRESGLGWSSSSPPPMAAATTPTSPLRIAKRDPTLQQQHQHPSQIARRSSTTFKRLNNTNLVSKSPFKSHIPTSPTLPISTTPPPFAAAFPSTHPTPKQTPRKLSGEKRARPTSLHEQAETENDRPPFAYKRERRQSKGYEGLIVKEPVTKSPFRSSSAVSPPPPPPPAKDTPPRSRHKQATPSPGRSSLVSKRLHGPRLSGGAEGRRQRRKTVTFDEQCDVVEFDAEEDAEVGGYEDMDVDGDGEEDMQIDELESDYQLHEGLPPTDAEADDSLTGMVNSMLHQTQSQSPSNAGLTTPPRPDKRGGYGLRDDEESEEAEQDEEEKREDEDEDNIPLGRTHTALHHPSPPPPAAPQYPFRSNTTSPTTPPKPSPLSYAHNYNRNRVTSPSPLSQSHSPSQANMTTTTNFSPTAFSPTNPPTTTAAVAVPPSLSPGTHIPLGRTTHAERLRAKREEEEEVERGVQGLEGSPSPIKGRKEGLGVGAGLVPRFGVRVMGGMGIGIRDMDDGDDPFAIPVSGTNRSSQPHRVSLSFSSPGGDASQSPSDSDSMEMVPAHLSFTGLEKELGLGVGLGISVGGGKTLKKKRVDVNGNERVNPRQSTPESDSSYTSEGNESPSSGENEGGLPPAPASAEFEPEAVVEQTALSRKEGSLSSRGSVSGRTPRINREDVKKRLMRKRSDSPVPEEYPLAEEREEGEGKSMTDFDLSNAEVGTIETVVEKRNVAMSIMTPPKAFPLPLPHPNLDGDGLNFDMGQFGMGEGISFGEVDVDMRSALDRLMDDVAAGSAGKASSSSAAARRKGSMRVEDLTGGVRAGRFGAGDDSGDSNSMSPREQTFGMGRPPLGRASTEPELFTSTPSSRTASGSTIPPPPPPKDAIRSREQLIIEKRREARRREEDESMGYYTPPKASDRIFMRRRRSRSTGDIRVKEGGSGMLDDVGGGLEKQRREDDLSDSIQRELRRLGGERSKYHVKEQATIYASSDAHRIEHMESAGDVSAGKAWRPVRRPSDMNEYSKQIKEYRAQQKPGKAHGKVFVRVIGLSGVNVPLPQQATAVTCTLNNGIHFVTTPECRFDRDSRIDQEFELIEHSKLEFTLTLKIRRDPHIISMFKTIIPTSAQPPAAPISKGGMRGFFSSPKKSKNASKSTPPSIPENLARYLKPDGTLARAFISFKDIAARCDTKLFETSYPLIGQRIEVGGAMSTLQVGELVLQVFRLPPLPGVPPDQLPQSLEECSRGLRHVNWHKVTYFEGTLTQQGGDCTTWRRRRLRVIGANLVAFNDVTKKATATIGLKKAIAVEDDQADPLGPTTARSRYADDYDGLGGVERSFRLIFPNDEEIMFFADTDEEKAKWLEVLRALVGHIPPNPLWAELIWQRQDELKNQAAAASPPSLPAVSFGDD